MVKVVRTNLICTHFLKLKKKFSGIPARIVDHLATIFESVPFTGKGFSSPKKAADHI